MVACGGLRQRPNVAGVGAIRAVGCNLIHPSKYPQASVLDQATTILANRARMGPRVSPRAHTVTQLHTPRLGVLG